VHMLVFINYWKEQVIR